MKYFVCHRFRQPLDSSYIKTFYKNKEYKKLYNYFEDAREEIRKEFYDDSDYDVIKIENNKFYIVKMKLEFKQI